MYEIEVVENYSSLAVSGSSVVFSQATLVKSCRAKLCI